MEFERKMEFEETIESYVRLLSELQTKTGDDATALALLQEIAKDRRGHEANGRNSGADGPATEKQKAYLDRLKVEYADEISKAEASRLIDDALNEEQD